MRPTVEMTPLQVERALGFMQRTKFKRLVGLTNRIEGALVAHGHPVETAYDTAAHIVMAASRGVDAVVNTLRNRWDASPMDVALATRAVMRLVAGENVMRVGL